MGAIVLAWLWAGLKVALLVAGVLVTVSIARFGAFEDTRNEQDR